MIMNRNTFNESDLIKKPVVAEISPPKPDPPKTKLMDSDPEDDGFFKKKPKEKPKELPKPAVVISAPAQKKKNALFDSEEEEDKPAKPIGGAAKATTPTTPTPTASKPLPVIGVSKPAVAAKKNPLFDEDSEEETSLFGKKPAAKPFPAQQPKQSLPVISQTPKTEPKQEPPQVVIVQPANV